MPSTGRPRSQRGAPMPRWAPGPDRRSAPGTRGPPETARSRAAFDDFESFEQQRLQPFYETVIERLPEAGGRHRAAPRRNCVERRCFVDGDFAMKNMLVGPDGQLGARLRGRALRQPRLRSRLLPFLRRPLRRFAGRRSTQSCARSPTVSCAATPTPPEQGFAGDDDRRDGAHGCLMLARTDGKSPAQFLDPPSRERPGRSGSGCCADPSWGSGSGL